MKKLILLKQLTIPTMQIRCTTHRPYDRPTLFHGGIVNVYIVYEITNNFNVSSYLTLENGLFGVAKLSKNADIGMDLIEKDSFHILLEELAEM